MDEPCSALDPISTLKIENLIHKLKEKYTIVMVTHDRQMAEYADRIVVLQDGKIEKIQKRIREKKENVYE